MTFGIFSPKPTLSPDHFEDWVILGNASKDGLKSIIVEVEAEAIQIREQAGLREKEYNNIYQAFSNCFLGGFNSSFKSSVMKTINSLRKWMDAKESVVGKNDLTFAKLKTTLGKIEDLLNAKTLYEPNINPPCNRLYLY